MKLIRSTYINGVAVLVKAISGLLLNKLLAIWVGPTGYGVIGQMQSFSVALVTISTGGINTGVVKYTAEYEGVIERQRNIWGNAFWICFSLSTISSVVLLIFNAKLSELLFNSEEYSGVLTLFSAGVFVFSLNSMLLSIVNGKRKIIDYAVLNGLQALCLCAVGMALTALFQLKGALVSLVVGQLVACTLTIIYLLKDDWFKFKEFFAPLKVGEIRKLSKFAFIGVSTSVIGPVTVMFIRALITEAVGNEQCGYWEALNKLSGAYLMFISFPLSAYLIPRLSGVSRKSEIIKEINKCLKLYVGIALLLGIGVYFLRVEVVNALYSKEFLPVTALLLWQVMGDVVRVASWVYSNFLISHALVLPFCVCEVVASACYVLTSSNLLTEFGTVGVPISYMVTNIVYLGLLLLVVNNHLNKIN